MSSIFPHLEAAAADNNVESLERHRETALRLAKALSGFQFAQANSTDDTHHWHHQLSELADDEQGGPAETLIMMVGSMGTGKSTAINALLDEPRLLPTSGYDACTSVATEVRYNYSTDPHEAYRAEITFITAEELLRELLVLSGDVLSAGEMAVSTAADDSTAEIAWAKIHAVWPHLTKVEMADPSFKLVNLLQDPLIRRYLGATLHICHPDAASLSRDLWRFIANRDNVALAKKAEGFEVEQQFWPLVEKVNIFVKAEVLSTGAVIRDMPGGQDGNSARSARAAADGDRCDHLCVFVPIKRAISEQIVKKPFNDASTFRNWIKFDGRLNDITYVCTMTDDSIEIDRDAEEFGLVEQLDDLTELEEALDAIEVALAETRAQLDTLHNEVQAPEGSSQYRMSGAKRKRSITSQFQRDKRLRGTSPSSSPEEGSYTTNHHPELSEDSREFLMPEAGITEAEELATKMQRLETHREALQKQLVHDESFLKVSCIEARNTRTSSAIKRDFNHAAKELLSHRREFRPGNKKPVLGVNVRTDLQAPTVHTVSARGYFESLKRRRKADFWAPDNTELSGIPAWRDHIKQLTMPARRRKCQNLLKAVLKCFNHMSIWCDNGSGISLTSEQEKRELAKYKTDLELCVERLGYHFETFLTECRGIFDRIFSERMKSALPEVISSAIDVANTWPSRKRGDQLLAAGSYRSACRNGGVYKGRARIKKKSPWCLNEELAQPLFDAIEHHWQHAFDSLLPTAFHTLRDNSAQAISDLSNAAEKRMELNMTESARRKLRGQMRAEIQGVYTVVDGMREEMIDETRPMIRKQIVSELKREMSDTWKTCAKITGTGCFHKQQEMIERFLEDKGADMFIRISSGVERLVGGKCNTMNDNLGRLKDSVDKDMWHTYTTTIVAKEDGRLSLRKEVLDFLMEADAQFKLLDERDM